VHKGGLQAETKALVAAGAVGRLAVEASNQGACTEIGGRCAASLMHVFVQSLQRLHEHFAFQWGANAKVR